MSRERSLTQTDVTSLLCCHFGGHQSRMTPLGEWDAECPTGWCVFLLEMRSFLIIFILLCNIRREVLYLKSNSGGGF